MEKGSGSKIYHIMCQTWWTSWPGITAKETESVVFTKVLTARGKKISEVYCAILSAQIQ